MKALVCVAIPLFAAAACATSKESAPPQASGSGTSQQGEAKPSAAQAPGGSGPTTASEAAERVHEEWLRTHGGRPGGSGGDLQRTEPDDGPCSSDDQCALTRVPAGGCCETLCFPRAVTRARADAIAANERTCTHGKPCPEVSCHPLGQFFEVKCESGKCTARQSPSRGQ